MGRKARTSRRATLDAIVATFAPRDAEIAASTALVSEALDRLAPHRRAKLELVLDLLGNPIAGFVLAGRFAGFARLDETRRERAVLRIARLRPLRPAFDAFSRLALFGAYTATDASGRSAVWERLRYPGPRDDIPPAVAFPCAEPRERGIVADAVVVGSGAGGGVAAALLAEAGLHVAVLEAGDAFEPIAARQREADTFAELYLEAGLCASEDLGVSILAGSCVGGGTAVNWSTSLRLPAARAAAWGDALDRPAFAAELADAYDAVETRLGVTVAKSHNRNNAVIMDGAAKLGWRTRAIPRNAECSGERCGYCCFGCAYGSKRSTAATYLRDAVAHGASVYARARVERVLLDGSPSERTPAIVRGVVAALAAAAGETHTLQVEAPLVVLAAGALRTPGLLARSGIASAHLGAHLRLHPTSALAARFAEPVEPWHGAMQTALCDQLDDAVIEAAPSHPGLMALALPWSGREAHAERMSDARYQATLIALTRDRGSGTVSLDERADVAYAIDPVDARHLAEGLIAAARIAFAAGAVEVGTLHAPQIVLDAADASDAGFDAFAREIVHRAERGAPLALFSAHQMGTARMGASADEGVIDPDGCVYGVEGLVVADASAFPSASGVNPMLTIMALAHRATSALIARRGAQAASDSPARSR